MGHLDRLGGAGHLYFRDGRLFRASLAGDEPERRAAAQQAGNRAHGLTRQTLSPPMALRLRSTVLNLPDRMGRLQQILLPAPSDQKIHYPDMRYAAAMKIRRAVLADGPAYLELVRALAEFEKLAPPDEAACERLVRDAFADPPRYELWVAELAPGELVAYAATFMTYSTLLARPTLFLEDIFVHPRARRRAVATMLINALRDTAVERGCGRMEWMVLDWNTDAQTFFNRMGAKPLRQWLLTRVEL